MRVLNVGGGASRVLPAEFDGWTQTSLDVDPLVQPDIVGDARDMHLQLMPADYDAVYCSHALEHFYRHDVPKVLAGFKHVLKPEGFAYIVVPNLNALIADMQGRGLDVDDVWYRTSGGQPITFHDVLYGWSVAMSNGNLHYAHKCGFTPISLHKVLADAGFTSIQLMEAGNNLMARACH